MDQWARANLEKRRWRTISQKAYGTEPCEASWQIGSRTLRRPGCDPISGRRSRCRYLVADQKLLSKTDFNVPFDQLLTPQFSQEGTLLPRQKALRSGLMTPSASFCLWYPRDCAGTSINQLTQILFPVHHFFFHILIAFWSDLGGSGIGSGRLLPAISTRLGQLIQIQKGCLHIARGRAIYAQPLLLSYSKYLDPYIGPSTINVERIIQLYPHYINTPWNQEAS